MALLVPVFALGCSSGGPLGSGKTVTETIGPSGGVVSHPDGAILTVMKGTLDHEQDFSITSFEDPPPAAYSTWYSPVFRFEPEGFQFDSPASVTILYYDGPSGLGLFWSTDAGKTFDLKPGNDDDTAISTDAITLLGRGFVAPGGGGGSNDACAPYTGSYAGILAFHWTGFTSAGCAGTPPEGSGTITVHFETTCIGAADGQVLLNVTTVSSDNAYLAMTTPGPAGPSSQVQLPANPPASGMGAISLEFANGATLGLGPNVTVTSGAATISSDTGDTEGWSVDPAPGDDADAPLWAAGMPQGGCAMTDARTFKINKL